MRTLSDLAGALAGSLGVAPTANIDPERRFPSMFEPIHGSAFDITGKGIANPVATFLTACQMLEHLGETAPAGRLMKAVEDVCAAGIMTPDVGGKATTREVTDAVIASIRGSNEQAVASLKGDVACPKSMSSSPAAALAVLRRR